MCMWWVCNACERGVQLAVRGRGKWFPQCASDGPVAANALCYSSYLQLCLPLLYLFLFEFHHKFTFLLVFMGQVDFFPDIYLVFQGGWFFRGVQRYPSKKWATAPFSVQIELMGKNAFKREQCGVEFLGAICSASSYLQIVKKLPILAKRTYKERGFYLMAFLSLSEYLLLRRNLIYHPDCSIRNLFTLSFLSQQISTLGKG